MTRKPLVPITKPDILLSDTTPLIHLALIGRLDLLHDVGGIVILVDVVRHEALRDPGKPGAREIADWIESGSRSGSNRPVSVEETETGRLLALARRTDPSVRAPHAGETAMVEWLAERVQGPDRSTVILYENGRVPNVVANQGIDADIDTLTTRAFLQLVQDRGLIASANALWEDILRKAPGANPQIRAVSQRRPDRADRS